MKKPPGVAPAADRVVTPDHNSSAYKEAIKRRVVGDRGIGCRGLLVLHSHRNYRCAAGLVIGVMGIVFGG